ncbi:MAG TPA: hypothetical protein VMW72_26120 [Sedimentisphaerales bacterium]|nr:hypothetical protein [Sedimentisphaerales bacterium]
MPTVEEQIRNDVDAGRADQQIVTDLFDNLYTLAQSYWKYAASRPSGFTVAGVLAGDARHSFNMNCQTISGLFVEIARRYFRDVLGRAPFPLAINNVDCNPRNFVTAAGYRCFDTKVVGNVCTPTQSVTAVGRCLFSEHWFVRIGTTYYDPVFCSTYPGANTIAGCQLDAAPTEHYTRGKKTRTLFKVVGVKSKGKYYTGTEGGTQYVFKKISAKSHGFAETYRMVLRDDLSDDDKKRMDLS